MRIGKSWLSAALVMILNIHVLAADGSTAAARSPVDIAQQQGPNGLIILDVVNRSDRSITAMVAVGDRVLNNSNRKVRSVRFFDSVLDGISLPDLRTNERYHFDFFGPRPPLAALKSRSVALEAVVFRDGSTWGSPDWVALLLNRRQLAYRYDEQILEILTGARLQGSDEKSIVSQLKAAHGACLSSARNVNERQIADIAFGEAEQMIVASAARLNDSKQSFAPGEMTRELTERETSRLFLRIKSIESGATTLSKLQP